MVQKFVVEVDSIEFLEQYLRVATTTALMDYKKIEIKIINREEKYLTSCKNGNKDFPVILIGETWYAPKKGEKLNSKTFKKDKAVEYIIKTLRENIIDWEKQFIKRFEEGYAYEFSEYNGKTRVGYELCLNNSMPESFVISLVHIYYGN